jgi:hypothetical protein
MFRQLIDLPDLGISCRPHQADAQHRIVALHGDDMLQVVALKNCDTGEERTIETFFCLGAVSGE